MRFLAIYLLLASTSLFAKDISVSQKSLGLNDTVTITLETPTPKGYHLDKESLKINLLASPTSDNPPFTLLSEEGQSFTLEPWQSGTHTLSFGVVTFLPDDPAINKPQRVLTGVVTIEVKEEKEPPPMTPQLLPPPGTPFLTITPETQRRLENTEEYSPAQATKNIQLFNERSFPWRTIVTLAAIAALIWGGRKWLWRHMRKTGIIGTDPRERAIKALERLEDDNLPSQGLHERFYVTVTNIVRVYIEEAFALQAPELTTEEFLVALSQSESFDRASKELLQDFLSYADLVKFAKELPSPENCESALAAAKKFVNSEN